MNENFTLIFHINPNNEKNVSEKHYKRNQNNSNRNMKFIALDFSEYTMEF